MSTRITAPKSGQAARPFQATITSSPHSRPMGAASRVVRAMPMIRAPLKRRITNTPVATRPRKKVARLASMWPRVTRVASLPTMKFAFCRPMKVMKSPMPQVMA